MSTSGLKEEVIGKEHIIIVGAGFNGLMCALEAQSRKQERQVDIVTQTLITDPHPTLWTTYLSRCFFSCMKSSASNLEKETFDYMLERATLTASPIHRFTLAEYFAMKKIDEAKVLEIPGIEDIPKCDLVPGAKHGATFTTVSVAPARLAEQMHYDFASQGGRVFRGTVRHIREIAEGGISAFQKAQQAGHLPVSPTAVAICVGIGARFLGGIEDNTVHPAQIHVLRLRIPNMKTGRAFYDNEDGPTLFVVPLGNGDAIVGGKVESGGWYPRPRRKTTDEILQRAVELCPDIIPPDVRDQEGFDARSLVVWEGCDTFGKRADGPRLEIMNIWCEEERRNVPVALSYGYGASELRVHREAARITIDLLEGAIEQQLLN